MRWYAGGGDGGDDDDDEGGGSSARCRIVAALPLLLPPSSSSPTTTTTLADLLEFSLFIVIDDSVDEAEASMACGEARHVIIITRGAVNENLKAFVIRSCLLERVVVCFSKQSENEQERKA
jgi:hypothetical protein